jgi:hypothetical protein
MRSFIVNVINDNSSLGNCRSQRRTSLITIVDHDVYLSSRAARRVRFPVKPPDDRGRLRAPDPSDRERSGRLGSLPAAVILAIYAFNESRISPGRRRVHVHVVRGGACQPADSTRSSTR